MTCDVRCTAYNTKYNTAKDDIFFCFPITICLFYYSIIIQKGDIEYCELKLDFILIVISKSNLLANLLNLQPFRPFLPTAMANAIIKYPRLTEEDHEESGKESPTLILRDFFFFLNNPRIFLSASQLTCVFSSGPLIYSLFFLFCFRYVARLSFSCREHTSSCIITRSTYQKVYELVIKFINVQ